MVLPQPPVVADQVQRRVGDGGREGGAVGVPEVAVVQVEAAGPKQNRREPELRLPVVDDRPAVELLRLSTNTIYQMVF